MAVRASEALCSEPRIRTNALIDWKLHLNLQVPLSVFAWTERRQRTASRAGHYGWIMYLELMIGYL